MAHLRLALSYVLDWIVVVGIAAVGGVFYSIDGYHRPFSLQDPAISYPNQPDIVSTWLLVIIALIAPGFIIAGLCLARTLFGSTKSISRRSAIRSMVWEVNAGWLGLCVALAATLFITTGLKDMVGKPRPDLLARCNANLTDIQPYVLGGYGTTLEAESGPFVSSSICQQPDKKLLDDGFAAFPSGHSSFSAAGMVYLALWLCARFSVSIPFLDYQTVGTPDERRRYTVFTQQRQSAPPLWLMAICFAPIVVALFVSSSRYTDFHHAGFDIIAGMLIGTAFGWAGFRLYHLPIRRNRGLLAWGPRPEKCAFLPEVQSFGQHVEDGRGQSSTDYELGAVHPDPRQRPHTGNSQQPILA